MPNYGPATATHYQLDKEQLHSAARTPDLARLSIGIEHISDIIADIDQTLNQVTL